MVDIKLLVITVLYMACLLLLLLLILLLLLCLLFDCVVQVQKLARTCHDPSSSSRRIYLTTATEVWSALFSNQRIIQDVPKTPRQSSILSSSYQNKERLHVAVRLTGRGVRVYLKYGIQKSVLLIM